MHYISAIPTVHKLKMLLMDSLAKYIHTMTFFDIWIYLMIDVCDEDLLYELILELYQL
jgi:hypothetical protein